jgi:hypothetical protein
MLSSPLKGGNSMMKTSCSGFFSLRASKNQDDAVKKTKMREAKVMIGLLKGEEIRSEKIQQQDVQYKNFLIRME